MKKNESNESGLKVFMSKHALDRIASRFDVDDPKQVVKVLERAATEGFVAGDGVELFLEYGCLLVVGTFDGDGAFRAEMVYNLANGISEKLKEQMWNNRPTPWESSEIVLPRENRGDADE